jgi:hypothetical protein
LVPHHLQVARGGAGITGGTAARGERLAAQAEPFDDGAIPGGILAHQVRKEATSLANELEQAATRVMILWETSKVFGQPRDPLRQERDLYLG